MPAIRPDVAIIHAQRADQAGNVLIEGIVGVQKQAVLAAKRSIVTVEEMVERFRGAQPQCGHSAVLDRQRHCVVPGRRAPVLRARLLHARQRHIQEVG